MKKRIVVLLLSFAFPILSKAQDEYDKFHFKGSAIYVTYFFASKLDAKISGGGTDISGSYSGSAISKFLVPAIGYRWDYIRNDGFGLMLGARYELDRTFNSATSEGHTVTTVPTFSFHSWSQTSAILWMVRIGILEQIIQ